METSFFFRAERERERETAAVVSLGRVQSRGSRSNDEAPSHHRVSLSLSLSSLTANERLENGSGSAPHSFRYCFFFFTFWSLWPHSKRASIGLALFCFVFTGNTVPAGERERVSERFLAMTTTMTTKTTCKCVCVCVCFLSFFSFPCFFFLIFAVEEQGIVSP